MDTNWIQLLPTADTTFDLAPFATNFSEGPMTSSEKQDCIVSALDIEPVGEVTASSELALFEERAILPPAGVLDVLDGNIITTANEGQVPHGSEYSNSPQDWEIIDILSTLEQVHGVDEAILQEVKSSALDLASCEETDPTLCNIDALSGHSKSERKNVIPLSPYAIDQISLIFRTSQSVCSDEDLNPFMKESKSRRRESSKKGGKRGRRTKVCRISGCTSRSRGRLHFCQKHGGGKRCASQNCLNGAQGSTEYCYQHGGGYRCIVEGCNTGSRGRSGRCARHGGQKKRKLMQGRVSHA